VVNPATNREPLLGRLVSEALNRLFFRRFGVLLQVGNPATNREPLLGRSVIGAANHLLFDVFAGDKARG
jgi:hypothetical protein